jgi:hypothetical protein
MELQDTFVPTPGGSFTKADVKDLYAMDATGTSVVLGWDPTGTIAGMFWDANGTFSASDAYSLDYHWSTTSNGGPGNFFNGGTTPFPAPDFFGGPDYTVMPGTVYMAGPWPGQHPAVTDATWDATVVPIPASVLLLGTGLVPLLRLRKRD